MCARGPRHTCSPPPLLLLRLLLRVEADYIFSILPTGVMQAHQVDARCGAGSAVHRLADTDWLAQTRGKDYLAEIIGGEGPRQATDEELQWIILLHGETECSARSLQGSTLSVTPARRTCAPSVHAGTHGPRQSA